MRTNIRFFFLYTLSITSINGHIMTVEFDHALLSSKGTLMVETLPIFLAQAYGENKIYNKYFDNAEWLTVHKLPLLTTFYTLQIFLVTSAYFNSTYIIKETKKALQKRNVFKR